MVHGFWATLARPIIGLSPMDGVTDAAFRFIMAKYGRPDVIVTEFTAAEGIRAGALRLLDDFYYHPSERPVVAQIFGSDPTAFYAAAGVASALGFDGLDINMGCPAKNVAGRGAGAALIGDPERAKEIIRQTRAGNQDWANGKNLRDYDLPLPLIELVEKRAAALGVQETSRRTLPVSVKTRIGISDIVMDEWVEHLLEESPSVISIHGRTLKQGYTGFANWEVIAKAAHRIHQTETLVLGNGDVPDLPTARSYAQQYGVDGVLIGRATFGNPWLFTETTADLATRLAVALEHADYLNSTLEGRGFIRMRKHLVDYTRTVPDCKELRQQLMRVSTLEELRLAIAQHLGSPAGV